MPDRQLNKAARRRQDIWHTPLPVRFFLCLGIVSLVSCDDRTNTISLTAEDFRFTPEIVRASSGSPFTVTVYNAGRETHEFDSAVLAFTVPPASSATPREAAGPGLLLEPGKSVRFALTPVPGTYLYFCRRKGHAKMSGMLIVE